MRSNLADRCECSYVPALPATVPHSVAYTGNDGLRADYHCALCGRDWWTSWRATSAGWPALDRSVPDENVPTLEQLP